MGSAAALITAGAGTGMSVAGQLAAGNEAAQAATVDAGTIAQTGELNAQLIEKGSELNAEVHDFNAAALEGQATDAVARGKEQETQFRTQLKQFIGTQRTSFAGQGVEVSSGSALDVQKDTAYQGELDALTIRTNAAREAWGYTVQAQGETLQAKNTRQLGTLQAANTRQVSQLNAVNARMGGSIKQNAANWGAASTLLTNSASILSHYGFGGSGAPRSSLASISSLMPEGDNG
jgi:hypothetical protein